MHIFRSGIKASSRKKSRVNVGVEETKEDKRKTAKSGEDKEGERECRRVHSLKNRMNKMCKEKKQGKTKYKLNLVVFQWAVNCSTAQRQRREVLLQVLSQLLIKSFMHSVA